MDEIKTNPNPIPEKSQELNSENLIKIADDALPVPLPDIVSAYIQNTLRPLYNITHYTVAESKYIGRVFVAMINLTTLEKVRNNITSTRIYICVEDQVIQHFVSSESFLRFIASKKLDQDNFDKIFRFEVVSGSLAFILLVSVVVSALFQGGRVDPVLGSGLNHSQ